MSAAITLDMLRVASSAEFRVIDLRPYRRSEAGVLARVADQFCYALEKIRYSMPFFYTPHINWPLACLPTCIGPDKPPITHGEYRVWWLNTNYGAKLNHTDLSTQTIQA